MKKKKSQLFYEKRNIKNNEILSLNQKNEFLKTKKHIRTKSDFLLQKNIQNGFIKKLRKMKSFKTLSKKSNNDFYNLKKKFVNSTKSFKNTPIKKKSIFNHFEDFDNLLNSKNKLLNTNYFSEKKLKKNVLKKNCFKFQNKNSLKLVFFNNGHNESIKKIEFVNNFIITFSDDILIKTWKFPFNTSEKKILNKNIKKNSNKNIRKISNNNISINLKKNSSKNISKNFQTKNLKNFEIKNSKRNIKKNLSRNLKRNLNINIEKDFNKIYRSNINKNNISFGIKNKQILKEIKNSFINSCSYKENFFVCDFNGFLYNFELEKKKRLFFKKNIFKNNERINFLDGYKNFVLGSCDNIIKLFKWDQKEIKEKLKFENSDYEKFRKIQFYNKSKFIVYNEEKKNNKFILYDIKKEKENTKIIQKKNSNNFKISKKLNLLVSSNEKNSITIFDLRTNKLIQNLNSEVEFINLIDIKNEENIFLSSGGNFLKLWDLRNFKCFDQYNFFNKDNYEGVVDAKFWGGNKVLTACDDGSFQVFNY